MCHLDRHDQGGRRRAYMTWPGLLSAGRSPVVHASIFIRFPGKLTDNLQAGACGDGGMPDGVQQAFSVFLFDDGKAFWSALFILLLLVFDGR